MTARLKPDLRPWISRNFGEVNYYVTQGHGCFRKYLHRMGKTASPYCLYEKGEVIGEAEYTVFECARAELSFCTGVNNWNDHGR